MGHELSTTAVQLALAGAVIANGGLLVQPRIIVEQGRPGDVVHREPAAPPRRVLAPETAITLRRMMERVVLHGTGKKARLDGYSSGGKTGSAQIYDHDLRRYTHRYNASFLGFAPLTNPAIVIAVTLNGATRFGGAVAAPVFREVAMTALRVLDVPRDLPDMSPPEETTPADVNDLAIAGLGGDEPPDEPGESHPEWAASPADLVGPRVPDFRGMSKRAVLAESSARGLPVELTGSGIARSQAPPAGGVLGRNEKIRVEFAR
jgi:cell division protein FtsI (penicillin-binding protein 3)